MQRISSIVLMPHFFNDTFSTCMTCATKNGSPLLTLESLMPFGKYQGLSIGDIIARDPNYVWWALHNIGSFNLDAEAFKAYKTKRFW